MARKSRKHLESAAPQSVKKAAFNTGAYIRLSPFDKRERNDSIETQQAIINSYIAERSDLELWETYIDSGVSGTNYERPAFKRMIADIESGKINCCIVKDLSRLGRNAIDSGYYIEKHFPSHGTRFIAINDDYDSADGQSGGIMVSLKNMINETYAIDTGRKTRATKLLQISEGAFIGKVPPYGYMKSSGDCHKLILDDYAAPVVKQIFQMYSDGVTVKNITVYLNETGVLPPYEYFHSKGWTSKKDARKCELWSRRAVSSILRNSIYCGDMIQGKFSRVDHVLKMLPKSEWVVTENTHEAIVEREVFDKIQSMKETAKTKQAVPRFSTPSSENIFRKKMYCGHCGYALVRSRKSSDKYFFGCKTKSVYGKSDCGVVSIGENELKDTIFRLLQKQAEVFAEKQTAQADSQAGASITAELKGVQSDIERSDGFLKGLYESLVSSVITTEEYRDMKKSYETKITALKERERLLREDIIKLAADDIKGTKASKTIKGLNGVNDISAGIIDALIERICVFGDSRIEVQFRFIDETAGGCGNE